MIGSPMMDLFKLRMLLKALLDLVRNHIYSFLYPQMYRMKSAV
jgi:hypothetical protein